MTNRLTLPNGMTIITDLSLEQLERKAALATEWLDKHIAAQASQKAALDNLAGGDASKLCEQITEKEEA